VLHISDSLVKLSLLTLVSKHESCLLVLGILSSLLNFALTIVESLSFLLELGLEVKDFLISVSFDLIELFLKALTIFSFLLPLLSEISACTLLVSKCEFKFLIEERLVLLKLRDLLVQFLAVLIRAIFLLFHSLVCLLLNLSHLLSESLFSISILVIKHLTLILERLLKASLSVIQLLLLLLVLLLEEGELTLPESLLFIECSFGFLQFRLSALKFAFEKLKVSGCTHCRLFVGLSEILVMFPKGFNLLLVSLH